MQLNLSKFYFFCFATLPPLYCFHDPPRNWQLSVIYGFFPLAKNHFQSPSFWPLALVRQSVAFTSTLPCCHIVPSYSVQRTLSQCQFFSHRHCAWQNLPVIFLRLIYIHLLNVLGSRAAYETEDVGWKLPLMSQGHVYKH